MTGWRGAEGLSRTHASGRWLGTKQAGVCAVGYMSSPKRHERERTRQRTKTRRGFQETALGASALERHRRVGKIIFLEGKLAGN